MKLVPVLLLNVATVAVALVVYDQLRREEHRPSPSRVTRPPVPSIPDTDAIEQRLRALEALPRPSFWDAEPAPPAAEPKDAPAKAIDRTADEAKPSSDEPLASWDPAEEPTAAEIRKFRQLREAVHREDRVKKNRERVDKALNRLSVNLTQRQRAGVHRAFAAFEPRVDEIWTEVKTQARETIAAGGEIDRGEIVASTTARIQQEFGATLTGVVNHQADAEAIAAALMPGGK